MVSRFFPLSEKRVYRLERSIRKRCKELPAEQTQRIYGWFTMLVPGLVKTRFEPRGEVVIVHQDGREIGFPNPMPLIKYQHVSFGYVAHLKNKYSLEGFVEVEPDDIVVDCGAFAGGFSIGAAKLARSLHLFEPSPQNAEVIRLNLADHSNAYVNECGLYDEDKIMILNVSSSAVEHSFLDPDDGDLVDTLSIPVQRLDTYFAAAGCAPDFVKIEAEGVEVEVLSGLGDLRPRKLAIDASPERNAQSPIEEMTASLESMGYTCRRRNYMLFALLNGS